MNGRKSEERVAVALYEAWMSTATIVCPSWQELVANPETIHPNGGQSYADAVAFWRQLARAAVEAI